MPKVSDDYTKAQEQKILRAAALCFSKTGYRLTSMTDIATRAGLSVGALYRYFPSKDTLFHALFLSAKQANQALWDAAGQRKTATERLKYVIDFHFRTMRDLDCRPALALDERLRTEALDDDDLAKHVRHSYQSQIDELSKLIQPTGSPGVKPRTSQRTAARSAAMAIIALINEARYQTLIGTDTDMLKYRMQVLDIGRIVIAGLEPRT